MTEAYDQLAALVPGKGDESAEPAREIMKEQRALAFDPVTAETAADLLMDRAELQKIADLLWERHQVIFYGPPGTGKTYLAKALARHLTDDGAVRLVQFHPSYTYEDFFEGFRPKSADEGTSTLTFELTPGPFRLFAEAAKDNPTTPYILIIDEINRANLAKVFGELYFLLEYRDEAISLQYSPKEEFTLPPNLFLIGTMNTADRSISRIDTAMRRRFAFIELDPRIPPVQGLLARWLASRDLPGEPAPAPGDPQLTAGRCGCGHRAVVSDEALDLRPAGRPGAGMAVRDHAAARGPVLRPAGHRLALRAVKPARGVRYTRVVVTELELDELGPAAELALAPDKGRLLAASGVVSAMPSPYVPGRWLVGPAGKVGAARVGDVVVRIKPKVEIARLLFLLGYSSHGAAWQDIVRRRGGSTR